jgi:hypothetical protein
MYEKLDRLLKGGPDAPEPPPSPLAPMPWERMRTETDAAWQAFTVYLAPGLSTRSGVPGGRRSLTACSRTLGHASPTQVKKWARQHAWAERAAALDNHLARKTVEAAEDAGTALAVRHTDVASKLLAVCESEASRYLELAEDPDNGPLTRSPGEVASILDLIQKIQRLSLGQSTSNASVRVSQTVSIETEPEKPCDLSLLTDTECALFETLMRKSKGLATSHAGYGVALEAATQVLSGAQCLAAPHVPGPSNPFAVA